MNKSYFVVFLVIALALFFNDTKAQWVEINNPSETGAFISFAGSGNNIFAGTDNGSGVFLSTDNGSSWNAVNNGLTATSVLALAISGNNIFAGTLANGVFLSTNNGSSWNAVNSGLPTDQFRTLAISGNNIFVGTAANGVFLSTNNGSSWTAVNSGMTNASVSTLAIGGNNNIFAGTDDGKGVFLSTDNGASWNAVNNGLTDTYVSALAISGNNIFAGTYESGVFLSTNNGTSWTAVNSGLTTSNKEVTALGISGNNIFIGSDDIFLSTNNGSSWTKVHNGLPTALLVSALAISGNTICLGLAGWHEGLLFLSTDNGASWNAVNNNAMSRQQSVFSFAIKPNGSGGNNIFAGTRYTGVFLSTDNGSSWSAVSNGLPSFPFIKSIVISGDNIFAGSGNQASIPGSGVFLSTNNGSSWTRLISGLTNKFVQGLAVSGNNIFAGTDGGGVYLSTNNGSSWTAVNNGLTSLKVWPLAISGDNLFAGTAGGVFLSMDNGSSWTAVNNGLTSLNVQSLAISGDNIYAGTQKGGVFRSTNSGLSWTEVNNGIPPNTDVQSFATSGDNIFAGTTSGDGVFLSTDQGSSWNSVNIGWPASFVVNGVTIKSVVWSFGISGNNIFAGPVMNGFWRRPLSELIATIPVAPNIVSPANGASNQSISVPFCWNVVSGATNYRLQVSTDSGFTNLVFNDSTLVDTSRVVGSLGNSTTYYWRVNSRNVLGTGPYSSTWSFTTIVKLPDLVTVISPAHGASVGTDSVRVVWNQSQPPVTRYWFERAADSLFTASVVIDTSVTDTVKVTRGLQTNTTYWVRVRAYNTAGYGPFSMPRKFSVILTSSIANIIDIPNDQGKHVRLTFKAAANDKTGSERPVAQYGIWRRIEPGSLGSVARSNKSNSIVEKSTSEIFTGDIASKISKLVSETGQTGSVLFGYEAVGVVPAIQDSIYRFVAPTLIDSTKSLGIKYSVFIITAHTQDPFNWSASLPDSGYSVDNLAPTAPGNLSGTVQDGNIALNWQQVPDYNDFSNFAVYRDTAVNFIPDAQKRIGKSVAHNYVDSTSEAGVHYYYKVSALDYAGNESGYSNEIVLIVTGIKDEENKIPETFGLSQNYPNPFNPATVISYQLPINSLVSIKIFDVLGKEVVELINEEKPAGRYEVKFNASFLSSGVYLYRIQAGVFVQTRKMILTK